MTAAPEAAQDPLDLLNDFASTPAAPPAPGGVDNLVQDPFADAVGSPDFNQGNVATPAVQVEGDLNQWFWGLATKDKGVIYEDTLMQVGVLKVLLSVSSFTIS